MKIFFKAKDGGEESTVTGYWLIESKRFFSIVLLKFEGKSREAYHTHAFNSISWLLKGKLTEKFKNNKDENVYFPSIKPIKTRRRDFHKVSSNGTSWVISFRGRWKQNWKEYTTSDGTYHLYSGRVRK